MSVILASTNGKVSFEMAAEQIMKEDEGIRSSKILGRIY